MTRRDQIEAVASVAGITTKQARAALDATSALIKLGLLEEEKFNLVGVGTFTVFRRSARTIRNPSTGVPMDLPSKAVVKFRPTPDLRNSVEERHK